MEIQLVVLRKLDSWLHPKETEINGRRLCNVAKADLKNDAVNLQLVQDLIKDSSE